MLHQEHVCGIPLAVWLAQAEFGRCRGPSIFGHRSCKPRLQIVCGTSSWRPGGLAPFIALFSGLKVDAVGLVVDKVAARRWALRLSSGRCAMQPFVRHGYLHIRPLHVVRRIAANCSWPLECLTELLRSLVWQRGSIGTIGLLTEHYRRRLVASRVCSCCCHAE